MKKKKMRKISLLLGAVLFGMSICTPSESICLGATELEIEPASEFVNIEASSEETVAASETFVIEGNESISAFEETDSDDFIVDMGEIAEEVTMTDEEKSQETSDDPGMDSEDFMSDFEEMGNEILLLSAGSVLASGSLSESIQWKITSDGCLTLSGNGALTESGTAYPWQSLQSIISSVMIDDGITSFPAGLLQGTSVTSVTIGNSVTSIPDNAFKNCSSLTTVVFGNSVTSIGSNAFLDCRKLTTLEMGPALKTIGTYAFSGCSLIQTISLPEGCESIGNYAFNLCTGLKNIVLPASIKNIGYGAFSGCSQIRKVSYGGTVQQWQNVTVGGGNNYFTAITVDCNDTVLAGGNVNNLYWALTKEGVLSINGSGAIPDYTVDRSYDIGDDERRDEEYLPSKAPWCKYEDKIKKVELGNSITAIGNRAFLNCQYLEEINIPAGVTRIGDFAFYKCFSLTSVVVPDRVTTLGQFAFAKCSALSFASLGRGISDISYNLFYDCRNLSSVTLSEGAEKISTYAFDTCEKLESITIPGTVKEIDHKAFYRCYALKTVRFAAGSGNASLNIADGAFTRCPAVHDYILPDGTPYANENGAIYDKYKYALLYFPSARGPEGVHLPDSVILIKSGSMTYMPAGSIVYMPENLYSIETDAISADADLKLIFSGDPPNYTKDSFAPSTTDYIMLLHPTGNSAWQDGVPFTGKNVSISVSSFGGIDLSECEITVPFLYEGTTTDYDRPVVSYQGEILENGTDYTVEFQDNKNGYGAFLFTAAESSKYSGSAIKQVFYPNYNTVSITSVTSTKISLSWGRPDFIGNYPYLYRSVNGGEWELYQKLGRNITSYKDTDIVSGNSYSYFLKLQQDGYSDKRIFITPSVTAIGKADFNIRNTASGVEISWNPVYKADSYSIYRQNYNETAIEEIAELPADQLSFTDTNVVSGKSYYYRVDVHTKDAAVSGGMTKTGSKKFYRYQAKPVIEVTNTADGIKITATTKSTGATGYDIYRMLTTDSEWTLIKEGSTSVYTDTTAQTGKIYRYRICGYYISSSGIRYDSAVSGYKSLMRLAKPEISEITNYIAGPHLSWKKETGVTGYYIYRRLASETEWQKIKTITSAATLSWTDSTAAANETYHYRISGYYKTSAGSIYESAPSGYKSMRYILRPDITSITSASKGLKLQWTSVSDITGYYIYRRSDSSEWERVKIYSNPASTVWTDSTVEKGVTYYYTVVSYYKASTTLFYKSSIANIGTKAIW